MVRAFREVYGIDDGFHSVEMAGRTDAQILQDALALRGLPWKEDRVHAFRQAYYHHLEREMRASTPTPRVLPGVRPLLEALQHRSSILCGLLTGNWREGATIKLAYFNLDRFFAVGAFADDSPQREQLVPIAVERVQQGRGLQLQRREVFVIGDTPLDIRCARPHQVRTIAVATGPFSFDELRRENPDYVFEDLGDYEKVLRLLEA